MQARVSAQRWSGLTLLGLLLVIVGVGSVALRVIRFDPFAAIAEAGWPYFVIIPGVALMVAALIPSPPRGVGFAIAGAIVTAVGSVLLYQDATGHWESWAYAWALVGPGAAGVAMLVYGLAFRVPSLVSVGGRIAAIAGTVFIVGYWIFETVFSTGRSPLDLGGWWPVGLVGVGLTVLIIGLFAPAPRAAGPATDRTAHGDVR